VLTITTLRTGKRSEREPETICPILVVAFVIAKIAAPFGFVALMAAANAES